jgi:hypothetical protein
LNLLTCHSVTTSPARQRELFSSLLSKATALLSTLVRGTFIVEHQPPQVLKTQVKFNASVRLLVGAKLSVHMNPPEVTVTLIAEKDIPKLAVDSSLLTSTSCAELLNGNKLMEYSPNCCTTVANFQNLLLKKIKRKNTSAEAVTEKKFALLFHTQFVIGDDLMFDIATLSLPIVVIVHVVQVCSGEATILWDNFFSQPEALRCTRLSHVVAAVRWLPE